jgi:AcrR family transcriptional regulator
LILDAALAELAEHGFERMSLESVASRAGVTKPTLYRRFRGKADLATAALKKLQQSTFPAPTGDTKADLTGVLADLQHCLLRPGGMSMIGALLVEERRQPELMRLFRERIIQTRRKALLAILEQARARGELRPRADIDACVNMLVGAFYARYLAGDAFKRDWPARLVACAWPGIVGINRGGASTRA